MAEGPVQVLLPEERPVGEDDSRRAMLHFEDLGLLARFQVVPVDGAAISKCRQCVQKKHFQS